MYSSRSSANGVWLAHARVTTSLIICFQARSFRRFAVWFAETEPARRTGLTGLLSEVDGKRRLDGPAGPFDLTARADRMDLTADGVVISDYKTGNLPSEKAVTDFVRPQLALEAAIALAGGFAGLGQVAVKGLRYIQAKGGEPPGDQKLLALEGSSPRQLAEAAIAGLTRRIADFDRESTPYAAQRRAGFQYDFDPFAHLARVAEWSAIGDDDDGSGTAPVGAANGSATGGDA